MISEIIEEWWKQYKKEKDRYALSVYLLWRKNYVAYFKTKGGPLWFAEIDKNGRFFYGDEDWERRLKRWAISHKPRLLKLARYLYIIVGFSVDMLMSVYTIFNIPYLIFVHPKYLEVKDLVIAIKDAFNNDLSNKLVTLFEFLMYINRGIIHGKVYPRLISIFIFLPMLKDVFTWLYVWYYVYIEYVTPVIVDIFGFLSKVEWCLRVLARYSKLKKRQFKAWYAHACTLGWTWVDEIIILYLIYGVWVIFASGWFDFIELKNPPIPDLEFEYHPDLTWVYEFGHWVQTSYDKFADEYLEPFTRDRRPLVKVEDEFRPDKYTKGGIDPTVEYYYHEWDPFQKYIVKIPPPKEPRELPDWLR